MFEGFDEDLIPVGPVDLFVRRAGTGPAVVLLHGHPRTSATWHKVAPQLVQRGFAVVCPDLRGYGRSGKPVSDEAHTPYSQRAMATDIAGLMARLGHDRYSVAGHDRGSYVALRLALDHPSSVRRLALLDSVPISEALRRCDARFANAWWHWFFYAQPEVPERVINADPGAWYADKGDAASMGQENFDEWARAIRDPSTVRAMLEDYRAGLGIDREHEEADRAAGRTLGQPVLVLWSRHDDLEYLYGDPLEVWRSWAPDLRGHRIESSHHMAELAPDALSRDLAEFFSSRHDVVAQRAP